MTYFALQDDASAETAEQNIYDEIADAFPTWEYAAGSLEVFLAKPLSRLWAAVIALDATVGEEAFRRFGQAIVNVPPILAAPATASATLTAIDSAGYTIPQGTQFSIAASGNETYGFETTSEVIIAPGSTATAAGGLPLSALIPGEAANGLTADPVPVDALAFISTVDLVGTTSGGVDEESPAAYLDRLTVQLRLLTPRPIIPRDFEVLALTIPGVARAVAIDGLDPSDDSLNNERTVAVAVVDEDGADLSGGVKTQIEDLLESLREINFVVAVFDADRSTIKVSTTFTTYPGYTGTAVEDSVEAAITDYLSPKNWGLPRFGDTASFNGGGWRNETVVYRNELISLVDRVDGVDHVTALTLAKGAAALGTSDVTLDGVVSLTTPGVINATAS